MGINGTRIRFAEISAEKKRKKTRWSTPCPCGISFLSPQFFQSRLICTARVSDFQRVETIHVHVAPVLHIGFQFFYARVTLPFSFFLSSTLSAPVRSSREGFASHLIADRCRVGRRIREIAGTMDSLASTVYFRHVPLGRNAGKFGRNIREDPVGGGEFEKKKKKEK